MTKCLVLLRLTRRGVFLAMIIGLLSCTPEMPEKRGIFFDFPVSGLQYTAEPSGFSGFTDGEGSFGYNEGDSLSFRIGDTILGTVTGSRLGYANGPCP